MASEIQVADNRSGPLLVPHPDGHVYASEVGRTRPGEVRDNYRKTDDESGDMDEGGE
jgi:hypothetical protein